MTQVKNELILIIFAVHNSKNLIHESCTWLVADTCHHSAGWRWL